MLDHNADRADNPRLVAEEDNSMTPLMSSEGRFHRQGTVG